MVSKKKFEFLDHPADVYIRAIGDSLPELFENAGIALFETMTNTDLISPSKEYSVNADGFDLESLLYRWLEELLYIYYSYNVMCSDIKVKKVSIERQENDFVYSIQGICRGEEFDPSRHEARVEVKAVTYHLMKIIKDEDHWEAYFVLDI